MTLKLTNVKTSKTSTLCYFWPKMGKNLVLIVFKCSTSGCFSIQLPLRCFYNHYFLLLNVFLMQIMKMPIDNNASVFVFPQHWNLAQIVTLRPNPLSFFNLNSNEMEPQYLTKSDVQVNPNILRTKNDKRVM